MWKRREARVRCRPNKFETKIMWKKIYTLKALMLIFQYYFTFVYLPPDVLFGSVFFLLYYYFFSRDILSLLCPPLRW